MSYRLRLIITISLLIAISFGVGGTVLITSSVQTTLETEIDMSLGSFEMVMSTLHLLNSMGAKADYGSMEAALSQMDAQKQGHWEAISLKSETKTIYQSNPSAMDVYSLPASGIGQCCYIQVHDQLGKGLIVSSTISAGKENLTLQARYNLSKVYENQKAQQQRYVMVYCIVVLSGIVIAVILSFALTRRLHRLTAAVRRISGGDLSTRSRINANDEFGQLSRDFDAMTDKLQENISRLESDIGRQESFLGAFAHEMKTPMTSIIGFADLLRQGNLDENTRMMAAEYIYSEGHRLENLSFKLLELLLLKKDALMMKRVALPVFVSEIEHALSPGLKKKGIRLICRAEQRRAVLEPDLVKSLLYNLIDNAGKAMEGEGLIALVATGIPGGCQFQVVDNGRGIPENELSKITEAFYRVDKSRSRKQGGAGLGLALCKQIVALHNGSIHFDSQLGKGTRVTVVLYGKEEKRK